MAEGINSIGRPKRAVKLPAHLRDYVLDQFHDITQSPAATTTSSSSQIDRLMRERQGIERDITRYCHKTDKLLHDQDSRPVLKKLDARLEQSFKELLQIKEKLLDQGEQLYPVEIEQTLEVIEDVKEKIEDYQDKIAVSLSLNSTPDRQSALKQPVFGSIKSHSSPNGARGESIEERPKMGQNTEKTTRQITAMRDRQEHLMQMLAEQRAREEAQVQAREVRQRKMLINVPKKIEKIETSKSRPTSEDTWHGASLQPSRSKIDRDSILQKTFVQPETSTKLIDRKKPGYDLLKGTESSNFMLSKSNSDIGHPVEERHSQEYAHFPSTSTNSDEAADLRRFFQGVAKPELPKFSGARDQFHDWWEQFDIFVNQTSVPVRFKMIMLKKSVTGPPFEMVKRLGYTDVQYKMALQKLHTRYGGERRLIQQHIDAIMAVPNLKDNDLKGLAEFSNRLFDMVAKLTDAAQDRDLVGPSALYTIVLKKIPDSLLILYQNDHPWTEEDGLATFVNWLNVQVAIRLEMAELKEPPKASKSEGGSRRKNHGEKPNRSHAHAAETKENKIVEPEKIQQSASKPVFACPLCSGHHGIGRCDKWREATVEKRWDLAKEHKVCYRCLYIGHLGKTCKSAKKCGVDGCTKTHHKSLHRVSSNPEISASERNGKRSTSESHTGLAVDRAGRVVPTRVGLRVIPVNIVVGSKKRTVLALLDDGSDTSYLRAEVATSLGLNIEESKLLLSTLTEKDNLIPSGLVSLVVEGLDGKMRATIGVRTLDSMCEGLKSPDWTKLQQDWEHLRGITFPKVHGYRKVDLLIGSDHPELSLTLEERVGGPGQPVARRTPLGWTCVGPLTSPTERSLTQCAHTAYGDSSTEELQLDEAVRMLWNMDAMDSKPTCNETPEEKLALQKASAALKFLEVEGRYQVSIPWKKDRPSLPDNRFMAEKRLRSLEAHLQRKPEVAAKYSDVFADNIKKGYIQDVRQEDKFTPAWYLPHFGVVKEDRATTKVRVVYDGAAVCKGQSLNDQMLPGPKLQQDILDILIKFRQGAVALIGDIQEMFSQILLDPQDRRYHRILWKDRTLESARLPFGDRASPFLAQLVIRTHAKLHDMEYPLAAETCLNNLYMDDVIRSIDSTEMAKKLRRELTELLKKGGFRIRKWCSNSVEVLMDTPEESRAPGILDLEESELPCQKPLGVLWNAEKDVIGYRHKPPEVEGITKRTLLSLIARLFDPLQLLAPYVIKAKMVLQEAWIGGLKWDEAFSDPLEKQARDWISELPLVESFEVPRCYHKGKPVSSELHTFTDASSVAYGAVVYIRDCYPNGEVTVRIVIAKSRVTPLKAVSIPRLELMAAVLGMRLAIKCKELLGISSMMFWTDSMDVIFWIHGQSRRYKPFVSHRVAQIQSETSPEQWRHVPGLQNPADLASRGAKMSDLTEEDFWRCGPEFLQSSEERWPPRKDVVEKEFSTSAQLDMSKSGSTVATQPARTLETESENATPLESILDCTRFSSMTRLVRVTAWVMRFIDCTRHKKRPDSPVLQSSELDVAEKYWIKESQKERLGPLIKHLRAGRLCNASNFKPLLPFIDSEGFVRVGGRLQNTELPYDVRHPYLIPQQTHIAKLLIRRVHCSGKHVRGVNAALADLRQKYWIVHGREELKRYGRSCVVCYMRKRRPYNQLMAPLPFHRSTVPVRAFARSGVDYAGPYLVKISRKTDAKRWLCLFTCTASRAVHLEVAYGLDTDSFLLAFSRMVARRGRPELVISDNGTNFVGANRELGELVRNLDRDRIVEEAANKSIEWRFNPPGGSHHGGLFEALIKSAKIALKSIIGEARLTDEELMTAVVEVEGILNSRPITYCSDDPQDDVVLTPNHFLIGQAGGQLAPRILEEVAVSPRERWRYVQQLVTQVWKRWNREFLSLLQTRGKWLDIKPEVGVGDIVLVADPTNPKGKWPLGRVVEVFPGKDGHTRNVRVLSRGKEFLRPITKLCPLGVSGEDSVANGSSLDHGGERAGARSPVLTTSRQRTVTAESVT